MLQYLFHTDSSFLVCIDPTKHGHYRKLGVQLARQTGVTVGEPNFGMGCPRFVSIWAHAHTAHHLQRSTVTASAIPFVYRISHMPPTLKILTIFLGFAVCFVILSISVEGLFFLAYSATLLVWVEVEAALRSQGNKPKTGEQGYKLQADDIRIALFFLFFVQVAFFGTGK